MSESLYVGLYGQAKEYARKVAAENTQVRDLSTKELTNAIFYDLLERERIAYAATMGGLRQ